MTQIALLVNNSKLLLEHFKAKNYFSSSQNRILYTNTFEINAIRSEFSIISNCKELYKKLLTEIETAIIQNKEFTYLNFTFESNIFMYRSTTIRDKIKSGKVFPLQITNMYFYDNIKSLTYPQKSLGIYVMKVTSQSKYNVIYQSKEPLFYFNTFDDYNIYLKHKSPEEIANYYKSKNNMIIYITNGDFIIENKKESKSYDNRLVYYVYNGSKWILITDYQELEDNRTVWYCQKILNYKNGNAAKNLSTLNRRY